MPIHLRALRSRGCLPFGAAPALPLGRLPAPPPLPVPFVAGALAALPPAGDDERAPVALRLPVTWVLLRESAPCSGHGMGLGRLAGYAEDRGTQDFSRRSTRRTHRVSPHARYIGTIGRWQGAERPSSWQSSDCCTSHPCTATSSASGSTSCSAGVAAVLRLALPGPEEDAQGLVDRGAHGAGTGTVSRRPRIVYQLTETGQDEFVRLMSEVGPDRVGGRQLRHPVRVLRTHGHGDPAAGARGAAHPPPGASGPGPGAAVADPEGGRPVRRGAAAPRRRVGRTRGPLALGPDQRRARPAEHRHRHRDREAAEETQQT